MCTLPDISCPLALVHVQVPYDAGSVTVVSFATAAAKGILQILGLARSCCFGSPGARETSAEWAKGRGWKLLGCILRGIVWDGMRCWTAKQVEEKGIKSLGLTGMQFGKKRWSEWQLMANHLYFVLSLPCPALVTGHSGSTRWSIFRFSQKELCSLAAWRHPLWE